MGFLRKQQTFVKIVIFLRLFYTLKGNEKAEGRGSLRASCCVTGNLLVWPGKFQLNINLLNHLEPI